MKLKEIRQKIRQKIFNKFNGKCAYCGRNIHNNNTNIFKEISIMEIDHIIPKSRFEEIFKEKKNIPNFLKHIDNVEHIDNKFPSCASCNRHKSDFTLETFRDELSKQLTRAKKKSFNYRMALKYGQVKETPTKIIFYFETFPW